MTRHIIVMLAICFSGCMSRPSSDWRKEDRENMFLFCGTPDQLLPENKGISLTVSPQVTLSDQLAIDEWKRVLVLIGRIPYVGSEITNVSGPKEIQGVTKIKTMTIMTDFYEILLIWDDNKDQWRIGSVVGQILGSVP